MLKIRKSTSDYDFRGIIENPGFAQLLVFTNQLHYDSVISLPGVNERDADQGKRREVFVVRKNVRVKGILDFEYKYLLTNTPWGEIIYVTEDSIIVKERG